MITSYRYPDTSISVERGEGKCTARVLIPHEERDPRHNIQLITPPTKGGARFHQVLAEVEVARMRRGIDISRVEYALILESLSNVESQICRKCGSKTMTYNRHAGLGRVWTGDGRPDKILYEGDGGEFILRWNTVYHGDHAQSLVYSPESGFNMASSGMFDPYVLGVFDPFDCALGTPNYHVILSSGCLTFQNHSVETSGLPDLKSTTKQSVGAGYIGTYPVPFVQPYIEHRDQAIRVLVHVLGNPSHEAVQGIATTVAR